MQSSCVGEARVGFITLVSGMGKERLECLVVLCVSGGRVEVGGDSVFDKLGEAMSLESLLIAVRNL